MPAAGYVQTDGYESYGRPGPCPVARENLSSADASVRAHSRNPGVSGAGRGAQRPPVPSLPCTALEAGGLAAHPATR